MRVSSLSQNTKYVHWASSIVEVHRTLSPITMWSMSTPVRPIPPNPTVAFTTPPNYAGRLSHLLAANGLNPLSSPTLLVEPTPLSISALKPFLPSLDAVFSAVAFTSRTGIAAFSAAISDLDRPLLSASTDGAFTIAALGMDSELLCDEFLSKFCENRNRIRILVPPIATPSGLVRSLGHGRGWRVLCPVPIVVDLEEPPVVPNFLRELESSRWVPVRVGAYETRWAGLECAKEVTEKIEKGDLAAIVFTSTAEVEGLLKSLRELGMDWREVKERCPGLVAAAHGPVTAAGAAMLGVEVDLVGDKFDSFNGVVNALRLRLNSSTCH